MENWFDLSGKTALVTGAAGGLGATIADALVSHGASVAAVDLGFDGGPGDDGPNVDRFICDITSEDDVRRCVDEVARRFDGIDVLVNNAGIHRRHSILDYPRQDMDAVMAVNFYGSYFVARAVASVMTTRQSGSIINISALGGGVRGLGRGGSVYCATKGAIVALTRECAAEWAPYGIRVNAVAPGWIRTPMTVGLQGNQLMEKRMLERVPLGRWGEPEDVAGPVLFLASDASRYVTGTVLPIDGGAANIIPISEGPEVSE